MNRLSLSLFALLPLSPMALAPTALAQGPQFHTPTRLTTEAGPIKVESPGYAFPVMHDLDGDGRQELIVGQFMKGKMKVYKRGADGKFAAGTWLEASGKVAEVPGVW